MKPQKVIPFPALVITISGPDAIAIREAATMFGKTPETYCCDYLKWFALMQLDGKP